MERVRLSEYFMFHNLRLIFAITSHVDCYSFTLCTLYIHSRFRPHKDSVNCMALGGTLLSEIGGSLQTDLKQLAPHRVYDNGNVVCTAARDMLLRGYSVPDGELLFSVKESGT